MCIVLCPHGACVCKYVCVCVFLYISTTNPTGVFQHHSTKELSRKICSVMCVCVCVYELSIGVMREGGREDAYNTYIQTKKYSLRWNGLISKWDVFAGGVSVICGFGCVCVCIAALNVYNMCTTLL